MSTQSENFKKMTTGSASDRSKAIKTSTQSIKRRVENLAQDIHETAVACLMMAEEHGNAQPMARLVAALGKKHRAQSLRIWVEKFSPIFIDTKDANRCGLLKEGKHKNYKPFDIEGAMAEPFWETAPEQPAYYGMSDVFGSVFGIEKKLEKFIEEGTFVGDIEAARILAAEISKSLPGTQATMKKETEAAIQEQLQADASNNNDDETEADSNNDAAPQETDDESIHDKQQEAA